MKELERTKPKRKELSPGATFVKELIATDRFQDECHPDNEVTQHKIKALGVPMVTDVACMLIKGIGAPQDNQFWDEQRREAATTVLGMMGGKLQDLPLDRIDLVNAAYIDSLYLTQKDPGTSAETEACLNRVDALLEPLRTPSQKEEVDIFLQEKAYPNPEDGEAIDLKHVSVNGERDYNAVGENHPFTRFVKSLRRVDRKTFDLPEGSPETMGDEWYINVLLEVPRESVTIGKKGN